MYKKAKVTLWHFVLLSAVCSSLFLLNACQAPTDASLRFFKAQDARIRKVGRFFEGPQLAPTVYAPGAYIEFAFSGTTCEVLLQDEERYGKHNFIVYQIDQQAPVRIQLKAAKNTLLLKAPKDEKQHWVRVCKASEATSGAISLLGIRCEQLHGVQAPKLLFEFIGDSITCGNGADAAEVSFGKGSWDAYHNAFLSYGALLSRALGTDWRLSAVSGIGMASSCCGLRYQMPEVYDQIGFTTYRKPLKFSKQRQPTAVFVTLGQNDRLRSAVAQKRYERAYLKFLKRLRNYYPKATFICCNSPMATAQDKALQNQCIRKVSQQFKQSTDTLIHTFAYQGIYRGGNDKHPTIAQHRLIMQELKGFVKNAGLFP
ncbi:MAG: GDSL-type esterase/lipase family protein [Flavobacteriales bacterium]